MLGVLPARGSVRPTASHGLWGRVDTADLRVVAGAATATLLIALLGAHKWGMAGLLAPLAVALALVLMRRPVVMVAGLVGLAALCEGPTFGLFHFSSELYKEIFKGLTPLDMLVALTVVSVAADLLRRRRALHVPRAMSLPLAILLLAMLAGAVTGHAAGASLRTVLFSENSLAYLLLLPLATVNLDVDRRQIMKLLGAAVVLALVKAVLGLIEVTGHLGLSIEGTSTLTYYEPTANWLVMMGLLCVFAAVVARVGQPRWMLLLSPLLAASLILSYRRSFWIATVLALALVLLLGLSPGGRKLLVPAGLLVVVAVVLVGSLDLQSQNPIVRRVSSLSPTKLEQNVEANYRNFERANVLGEIDRHPFTGLGLAIPWQASVKPLPVEHENGRQYVHFAALWFWLKLGLLGLFAYIGVMVAALLLAFRVWRQSGEPLLKAFGLASMCAFVGLAVMDTTASFTGVDPRFTVIFSVQIGLLALLVRRREARPPDPKPEVSFVAM